MVDLLADRLAEMEVKTPGKTLADVEAKAVMGKLEEKTPAEVDALCNTVA